MINLKMRTLRFPILLAMFLFNSAYADIATPDSMVKNTTNDVLEILKTDQDIAQGDAHKLARLVEDKIANKFDFDRISRSVLGREWNSTSREDKDKFIVEFRSLLIRTYSSALSKYRNQTIESKPLLAEPGDNEVKVKTQIVQPGGPIIPLDYSMEKIDDGWKVYDVSIDGLSLVTTYRGQFAEEVKQNGVNGVTQRLAEKNKS
jgi:phospholipid transport system substrate-binding protein